MRRLTLLGVVLVLCTSAFFPGAEAYQKKLKAFEDTELIQKNVCYDAKGRLGLFNITRPMHVMGFHLTHHQGGEMKCNSKAAPSTFGCWPEGATTVQLYEYIVFKHSDKIIAPIRDGLDARITFNGDGSYEKIGVPFAKSKSDLIIHTTPSVILLDEGTELGIHYKDKEPSDNSDTTHCVDVYVFELQYDTKVVNVGANICYSATRNAATTSVGDFKIPYDMFVSAFRLRYRSGSLRCGGECDKSPTHFGCAYEMRFLYSHCNFYHEVIANDAKEVVGPDDSARDAKSSGYGLFSMGFSSSATVLPIPLRPLSFFHQNEQLHLWHDILLNDPTFGADNTGATCVDIEAVILDVPIVEVPVAGSVCYGASTPTFRIKDIMVAMGFRLKHVSQQIRCSLATCDSNPNPFGCWNGIPAGGGISSSQGDCNPKGIYEALTFTDPLETQIAPPLWHAPLWKRGFAVSDTVNASIVLPTAPFTFLDGMVYLNLKYNMKSVETEHCVSISVLRLDRRLRNFKAGEVCYNAETPHVVDAGFFKMAASAPAVAMELIHVNGSMKCGSDAMCGGTASKFGCTCNDEQYSGYGEYIALGYGSRISYLPQHPTFQFKYRTGCGAKTTFDDRLECCAKMCREASYCCAYDTYGKPTMTESSNKVLSCTQGCMIQLTSMATYETCLGICNENSGAECVYTLSQLGLPTMQKCTPCADLDSSNVKCCSGGACNAHSCFNGCFHASRRQLGAFYDSVYSKNAPTRNHLMIPFNSGVLRFEMGTEFMLWYADSIINSGTSDNQGKHCVIVRMKLIGDVPFSSATTQTLTRTRTATPTYATKSLTLNHTSSISRSPSLTQSSTSTVTKSHTPVATGTVTRTLELPTTLQPTTPAPTPPRTRLPTPVPTTHAPTTHAPTTPAPTTSAPKPIKQSSVSALSKVMPEESATAVAGSTAASAAIAGAVNPAAASSAVRTGAIIGAIECTFSDVSLEPTRMLFPFYTAVGDSRLKNYVGAVIFTSLIFILPPILALLAVRYVLRPSKAHAKGAREECDKISSECSSSIQQHDSFDSPIPFDSDDDLKTTSAKRKTENDDDDDATHNTKYPRVTFWLVRIWGPFVATMIAYFLPSVCGAFVLILRHSGDPRGIFLASLALTGVFAVFGTVMYNLTASFSDNVAPEGYNPRFNYKKLSEIVRMMASDSVSERLKAEETLEQLSQEEVEQLEKFAEEAEPPQLEAVQGDATSTGGSNKSQHAMAKEAAKSRLLKIDWVNLKPDSFFVETYAAFFDGTHSPQHVTSRLYFFEDIAISAVIAMVENWRPPEASACQFIALAMLMVIAAHVAYLVFVRPYRVLVEFFFVLVIAIVQLAMVALTLAVLSNPKWMTLLGYFTMAQSGIFFMQTVVLCAWMCYSHHFESRARLRKKERRQQRQKGVLEVPLLEEEKGNPLAKSNPQQHSSS